MSEPPIGRRSHYVPRTRSGRIAVVLFVFFSVLAQPPIVHQVVNRIEPWILGMPFLYAWLLAVYTSLIRVLLWALKKRI